MVVKRYLCAINMSMLNLFVLLMCFVYGHCYKAITVGDITTKVSLETDSPSITVYKGYDESAGVTISYSNIIEVKADGSQVDKKRRYNNIGVLANSYGDVMVRNYSTTDIQVTQVDFEIQAPVDTSVAKIKTTVYVFLSNGTIRMDNEDVAIQPGMMKFDIRIQDWTFCVGCTVKGNVVTGEFLELGIDIVKQGSSMTLTQSSGPLKYSIGNDSSTTMVFPTQAVFDGQMIKSMPSGYPMLTASSETRNNILLRFPRFDNVVEYDPLLDVNSGEVPPQVEKEFQEGHITAKVLGQSGKISLMKDMESVHVELAGLQELKSDMTAVKDMNHKINNFANQEFAFSPLMEENYPGTEIKAHAMKFESMLKNGAFVRVYLFLFKEDGNITNGNETIMAKKGSVKFNVQISDWAFCTESTCQQSEVGEYLDLHVTMKGQSSEGENMAEQDGNKFTFGNAVVTLSQMIVVDGGNATSMDSNFPKHETMDGKDVFKFRFPKFTNDVLYDPTIDFVEEDDGGSGGNNGGGDGGGGGGNGNATQPTPEPGYSSAETHFLSASLLLFTCLFTFFKYIIH